jgi:hypothetical protein
MKTKDQIIKDQESIGNIQITSEEYFGKTEECVDVWTGAEHIYFKPKPEDKRVFENETYIIEINNNGLNIHDKEINQVFNFAKTLSLPLLLEAIKEAERQGLWNTDGVNHRVSE